MHYEVMEYLYIVINEALMFNRSSNRKSNSKESLPYFIEGDFVLVAHEDFAAGEKLRLRLRVPRRIFQALINYAFKVEERCIFARYIALAFTSITTHR